MLSEFFSVTDKRKHSFFAVYQEQQRNDMKYLVSVARDINNKIYLQKRSRKKNVKKIKSYKKNKEMKKVTRVVKGGDSLLDALSRSA